MISKKYRFKSSIAVVQIDSSTVEFFESNERRLRRIETSDQSIKQIIASLDGNNTVADVINIHRDYESADLLRLIDFFLSERFVIEVDEEYPEVLLRKYGRLVNSLESHSASVSETLNRIGRLQGANILIVGCGGVGSWVAAGLAATGVQNLYLLDDDAVEASNLNRQTIFRVCDVGRPKAHVLAEQLNDRYGVNVQPKLGRLTTVDSIEELNTGFDLIINCADEPSVDATSKIVSDYSLPRRIAHIIGGGYNLHLTLIGQLIVPGKTACFECFGNYLKKINDPQVFGYRKLNRHRKIGSFGALCAFSASITLNNAIRYLAGISLAGVSGSNRRFEFSLSSLDLSSMEIPNEYRCGECGW